MEKVSDTHKSSQTHNSSYRETGSHLIDKNGKWAWNENLFTYEKALRNKNCLQELKGWNEWAQLNNRVCINELRCSAEKKHVHVKKNSSMNEKWGHNTNTEKFSFLMPKNMEEWN